MLQTQSLQILMSPELLERPSKAVSSLQCLLCVSRLDRACNWMCILHSRNVSAGGIERGLSLRQQPGAGNCQIQVMLPRVIWITLVLMSRASPRPSVRRGGLIGGPRSITRIYIGAIIRDRDGQRQNGQLGRRDMVQSLKPLTALV